AGFDFMHLPIADGAAPSFEQAAEFVRFVDAQQTMKRAVAVHCEAGIGRTGTMLATYLIAKGETATGAIRRVRVVEKSAVETVQQIRFLEDYARRI
ncbi:MAG: hypothetical protein JWM68_4448, partial [Verrucomicrobiales bacterium]|nr:hypothetical protein [Verrucomicrobiales bacterium]